MNSVSQVYRRLASCTYIGVLLHMLVGLASIILTLSMQWTSATYASTGVIFQEVDSIAPASLKNPYLIEDSRPFFGQPAVDSPLTARASAIPGHWWLRGFLDFVKGQLPAIALPVKRQYALVDQPLLADSTPSPESIYEDHLNMLIQNSLSLSDDATLNKTLFEWTPNLPASPLSSGSGGGDDDGDDGNNQGYDYSEPEPLIVVYGEKNWPTQDSAEKLLSKTLKNKRRLLRIVHKKLQRAIAEGNSELVKILGDRLMLIEVELVSQQRQFQSPVTPESSTQRIGRQVPNSNTQTGHSEKPSVSHPSTRQKRQAPISCSVLGKKQCTRRLGGGDGGNGNPSHNGHTRNNHCPMCNNGPCEKSRWQPCTSETCTSEKRLRDSSGRTASYVDRGITNLPNEMVLKILSNLDLRTISVCRRVNSSWQALIDESHLPALAFCRALHYRPIPHTVEHYHSSTRGWLTGFGDEGKKLAEELDKHLEDKYFPEMLFFATAEVLVRTKLLTCQNVFNTQDGIWVFDASFSPDGHHLVTVSGLLNEIVKIWGLVDGQWQEKAKIKYTDWVNNVCFSPDGRHIVIAPRDKTAKIWGLVDGQWQEKATIEHADRMYNASFSPDGHYLVTASKHKTARIWGLVDGQWQEKATTEYKYRVGYVSFSHNEQHLVTASYDHKAQIWRLVGGQWQEKATIEDEGWVRYVSFSPDGQYFVTALIDTAKIWGLIDGQWQKKATIRHNESVYNASFSPDGHHLVTASYDNTAQIWRLVGGQWLHEATIKHDGWAMNASFSPDGHHFMAASGRTVNIWGLVDGQWQEKATIECEDRVRNACFSPDGYHLVIVSSGTAKIWLIKSRGGDSLNINPDSAAPDDPAPYTTPATHTK